MSILSFSTHRDIALRSHAADIMWNTRTGFEKTRACTSSSSRQNRAKALSQRKRNHPTHSSQLKKSSVGNLLKVQLTAGNESKPTGDSAKCVAGKSSDLATIPQNRFILDWCLDINALQTAERGDGRYLLVTNDFSLSYSQMLALYRKKDAVEKRFEVSKQDLKIRPLYIHSDDRIQAMLLINLVALLVYSLLERQAEQYGLCLTCPPDYWETLHFAGSANRGLGR